MLCKFGLTLRTFKKMSMKDGSWNPGQAENKGHGTCDQCALSFSQPDEDMLQCLSDPILVQSKAEPSLYFTEK